MTKLLSAKRLPALVGIILTMILAVSLVPLNALASDNLQTQAVPLNGTCGECTWTIDAEGALVVRPTNDSEGALADFAELPDPWVLSEDRGSITSAVIESGVKANGSLAEMFSPCTALKTADLSKFDTTEATSMGSMFGGCLALESVDLSGLKTSKVTEMNGMFSGCEKLKSINLSSFNTAIVESMEDMFRDCKSLTELNLTTFDTANVQYMSGMLSGCESLNKLVVGDKFSFKGTDGSSCGLPEGNWHSQKENKTFTAAQIVADRSKIADTYTKAAAPVEEKPNPAEDLVDEGENVYRLYNPNNGDHFYTSNASERDWLADEIGWIYEEVAWIAPEMGGEVYRLYNPNNGDHLYTTSVSERDWLRNDIGWVYEGICWHTAGSDGAAIYRLFNPNANIGCHLWTSSVSERNWLRYDIGWIYEEIAWYALAV